MNGELLNLGKIHFNPRSREGSDLDLMSGLFAETDFNPRSREGSDNAMCWESGDTDISIHAPAKGATFIISCIDSMIIIFQSTLPRRERRRHDSSHKSHNNFNPRSREGSDHFKNPISRRQLISIHAPAKGATYNSNMYFTKIGISIHAPAKGATIVRSILILLLMNFNPRSREGSDDYV